MAAGKRRVFVTGLGLVSPHGSAPDEIFERLYAGESAVRRIRTGTPEFGNDVLAAPVEFDATGVLPKAQLFGMDRVAQMAVVAAHAALASSGLLTEDRGPEGAGLYIGCGLGGSH